MKSIISLLILWFLCQACYFSPALRTGRTLEEGQKQVGANISTFVVPDDDITETVAVPVPEAYFATGVTDNIDVMGKISLSSVHFEGRYQFIGDKISPIAASAGLGMSVSFFALGENYMTLTPTIPLFLSYHPTDKFALYASPRYSVVAIQGADTDGLPGVFSFAGGIEMGKEIVFNLEAGFQRFHYATWTGEGPRGDGSALLPNFAVGFGYRFGGKR